MSNLIHLSSGRTIVPALLVALLAACEPAATPSADAASPAGAATGLPATSAAPAAAVVAESGADGSPAHVELHGVDLTGVGHDLGDPRAPIVMVEFSDFGCPYCAQHATQTLPSLEREYIDTGKLFYKHVPFVMGMFPNGDRAARAAECAGEQDRFWPMHDSVYAHQGDWKRGNDPDAVLGRLARQVVPDGARWDACYDADRRGARTAAASERAARLGVRATPTFFIDGQLVEGALPLDVMRQGLDALLRERTSR